jgi:hypothetical protein
VKDAAAPGRLCPVSYRYSPKELDREPQVVADALYVVGGLYGNVEALAALERLVAAHPGRVVFNGDFHWFDAEPDWFAAIEKGVARHRAIRGNVETEIARAGDIGAGCGCAYPESVDEGIVTRSNEILADLRQAAGDAATTAHLAALPMHLVASVGDKRIGIVHGDAASLAGWRFAHDALDDPAGDAWRDDVRAKSTVDIFTSTHTCLAALRDYDLPSGHLTVINNGSAGMANFSGTTHGLVSRIARVPCPHPTLYGVARDGVFVDALAVEFDLGEFLARFDARWLKDSSAYTSYRERIVSGPHHSPDQAMDRGRFTA